MRADPAGDADYDGADVGPGYGRIRRPDPRLARAIRDALGDVESVVNVGAGTGSYEPTDLEVTAVEPSASMRAARPAHLAPAIDGTAAELPFDDGQFDGALATFTVHQWPDLNAGLTELRRVTRGPIVILTADPDVLGRFWLRDYGAALMRAEAGRMPPIPRILESLDGEVEVLHVPIPADCTDGFVEAFFGRPEQLLRPEVRAAQSAWQFIDENEHRRTVERLEDAIDDGTWDLSYGHLRDAPHYDGSLRLVVAPGHADR